jgi:hypothetical protein
MSRTRVEKLTREMRAETRTRFKMDAVIETLNAFVTNHIFWAPEQFQEIYDEDIRKAVRAAFREPSNFIPNLLQSGSKDDIDAFSEAVKTKALPMYASTMAGFLEMLYSQEVRQLPYSKDLVLWFREKGWQFPKFAFETIALLPPSPPPSPALCSQPQITLEKIDSDEPSNQKYPNSNNGASSSEAQQVF